MIDWGLAGQVLVVGILLAAGCYVIYCQYQEQRQRYERRTEQRRRAAPPPKPHDVTPWIPADEDEAHEDFEHMRVVREATP